MSAGWDHPLFNAVRRGRERDVRKRLAAGDDINMPSGGFNDYGGLGHTVLHVAVREHRLKMVRLLLTLGADPGRTSFPGGPGTLGKSPLGLLISAWPKAEDRSWRAQEQGVADDEGSLWASPGHYERTARAFLDHDHRLMYQAQAHGETPWSIAQRHAQAGTPDPLTLLATYQVERERQALNAQLVGTPVLSVHEGRARL